MLARRLAPGALVRAKLLWVTEAHTAERAAQASWARTQQLVAQGFLSPAALDDARRARDVAAAQLASAWAQSQASGERGSDVAQAQAQLNLAQAATLVAQGAIRPVIGQRFPLEQIAVAHRLVDSGRKRGSVVIEIGTPG